MELKGVLQKLPGYLSKYRYAACILLVGIVLMMIPTAENTRQTPEIPEERTESEPDTQTRLAEVLSKIQGAGRVEVLLSIASGSQTSYHSDIREDADSNQSTAVIITDGSRNESALVSRVDPPRYLGAIVLCQGADSAAVRLAIVEAVSKYTGLRADQIAVLKMK